MKNTKLIFILAVLVAMFSCKEEDGNPVDTTDPREYTPEVIQEVYGQARVIGYVKDKAGEPLNGVSVYFGTHESLTDGEGKFELTEVSEGASKRIWFEKEGYVLNQQLVDVREDLPNRVDAALFPIAKTGVIGDEGGKIEGDDFSVEIEAGGFVYSDGAAVEGDVSVAATPFLITEENFIDAFPGDFRGRREDGSTTAIESFGFIDVDLRDAEGEPVQMADGVTATIKIKAPANAPQTIPMWWYDTKNAEWIEEGIGSIVGSDYVAEVKHFTAWNWDKPIELLSTIIGRVVDNEGNPIEGASLVQTGKNRRFQLSSKSDEDGSFGMFTLENLELELEAQFDIYGSTVEEYTTSAGATTVNDLGDILIDVSLENVSSPVITIDTLYITLGNIATIRGEYFGDEKRENYRLLLNGVEVPTISWQNEVIEFEVPLGISEEGTIQIDRDGKMSFETPYIEGDWTCEIDGRVYDNSDLPHSNNSGYYLNESYENLTSLPECIGNLNNLESLDLYNNRLSSLPESIGNLDNLKTLELSYNQLTTLPETIGSLNNLRELKLHNNQLSTLPETIGNLDNLELLQLQDNKLSSLPESIGNLDNLKTLGLSYNQLTTLPETIGNLNNLEWLGIIGNKLSSLPESIVNLDNLDWLVLDNNELSSLPESIGNLDNLVTLKLNYNKLSSLPVTIGNLTNLERLELQNNRLTTLPETIGSLNNLRELKLHNNQLTALPETIGNLKNLGKLYLDGNNFSEAEKAKVESWLPNTKIVW